MNRLKEHWKNILGIVIALILILGLGVGISYAWWRYTVIQDKTNVGASKCFSIELSNQANEINLTNMYPISDEEGRKLTPYTFTLKNTCTMSAKYTLNMEMLEGTTLNSKYLAVLVNNGSIKLLSSYDTATTLIDGSTESRILDTGILQAKGSKDYSIALWMDKDVTLSDDAQNKTFKSKIVVDAEATETVADKVIAQLDTTGKCPTVNSDGTVKVTSEEATDGYLCSVSDTYGTSYYYRGNVTNNYVKFAGFYWRILRINGDGTIRLIYDGTSIHTNGEASTDRHIGSTAYNYGANDNTYGGYMYGNASSIVTGNTLAYTNYTNTSTYYIAKDYNFDETTKKFSLKDPITVLGSDIGNYIGYYTFNSTTDNVSNLVMEKIFRVTAGDSTTKVEYYYVDYGTISKETAQTNNNNSKIKDKLDSWYEDNIKGTVYEKYVTDNIFCNDRSFSSTNKGTGAGLISTDYRWQTNQNDKLMLTCSTRNDAFTVNDTTYGNGALTYPVGLLSADELVLAGAYNKVTNKGFYLYTGSYSWLMTPSYLVAYTLSGKIQSSNGYLDNRGVGSPGQARPVINIKPDALSKGDGSVEKPYMTSD